MGTFDLVLFKAQLREPFLKMFDNHYTHKRITEPNFSILGGRFGFFFFWSGKGKGESEALGGGGGGRFF